MAKLDETIAIPSAELEVCVSKEEHGFGLFEMRGRRPSQEDAAATRWYPKSAFSSFTPEEIGQRLWTTYKVLNQHCCQPQFAGATASTTIYDGKGHLITATLGDTVAFAVVYGVESIPLSVTRLNKVIHHPEADKERLKNAGGVIIQGRVQGINGTLALSRALGDYEYSKLGVCDDAHIDITPIAELGAGPLGKIQIITTCDGFTDPARAQTKKGHEYWLLRCLQEIIHREQMPESVLAKQLALKAFNAHSQDNISIAVQTLSATQAFLLGIYDGHGGVHTSTYIAAHIGDVFAQQCALNPQKYAQQRLSAARYFELYYRDNKDKFFYESLLTEKKRRLGELSKTGGIQEQLQHLNVKKDVFVDAVVVAGEDIGAPMRAVLAITELCVFVESLCTRYADLELDKKEFLACLKYVLKNDMRASFDAEKYQFLSFDFTKYQESANFLKKNHGLSEQLEALFYASLEPVTMGSGLVHHHLFKAVAKPTGDELPQDRHETDEDPSPGL